MNIINNRLLGILLENHILFLQDVKPFSFTGLNPTGLKLVETILKTFLAYFGNYQRNKTENYLGLVLLKKMTKNNF